jgi:uncharacterized protein YtpQ (UPF0354 family)
MSGRLCGVLIVLWAMVYGPALAQGVPRGEAAFTEYVAAELRRELKDVAVAVKGPLTLALGNGNMQANLDRIFTYCRNNVKGCERELAVYVKGVVETVRDQRAPPSKEAVRILVRTRGYAESSPEMKEDLQPRALAGGLVMLPAIDLPRTIRLLTKKDNEELGLSTDEVFTLGVANLRARLTPLMQVATVAQPGQIGHLSGDTYHSSRLALHESWSPLAKAQGGKLIVAAPATDTVLYVGEDTPPAIRALRTLAQKVMQGAPNPLSSELLRWTPTGWEAVR